VTKADDSTLCHADRLIVEERARALLERADAWGMIPTPIEDILAAAKLKIAPKGIFDPDAILEYLKGKAADASRWLKSAVKKVFGVCDSEENIIHIDPDVAKSKQTFLTLHETGHHELPTHRKLFKFFMDCEVTLSPEIADQFEREANNFARFALFQGDAYAQRAADFPLAVKSPMKLAEQFGASVYASAREFARTNHRACAVYVLEQIKFVEGDGARADVRRIEVSPSYALQFGKPTDTVITLDHVLGRILPIGRRMTKATPLKIKDQNGDLCDCIAEAFDTTHNVIILLFPASALRPTLIIPGRLAG
jgi:hypothetical protein